MPPGGWEHPIAQPHAWAGTPLSGWWRRVGAYLLDSIFTSIVSWVGLGLLFGGSEAIVVILFLPGGFASLWPMVTAHWARRSSR